MFPGNLSFPPHIVICFCFSQHLFCGLREFLAGKLKTQTIDREQQELCWCPFVFYGSSDGFIPFTHSKIKWKWLNKTHFPLEESSVQSPFQSEKRKWSLLRNRQERTSFSVSFRNGLKPPVNTPFNQMRPPTWKSGWV